MTLPAERIVMLSPTHAAEPRVPVTAKLSKRFYDVLGEDVANDLVEWFNAVDLAYRTDLRELNELNFARFDAKLEQRLAELRAELRVEFRTELQHVRTRSPPGPHRTAALDVRLLGHHPPQHWRPAGRYPQLRTKLAIRTQDAPATDADPTVRRSKPGLPGVYGLASTTARIHGWMQHM
jgi:hypothetical protein